MKKILLIIAVFLVSCQSATDKPKTEPVEIYKVVFNNGHVDTLKLKSPVKIEYNWNSNKNELISDGNRVASDVSYFKKLN